ncbi:glycosyltransferase [Nocardia testacea]|uniref:glycosyltransferase n=1 Tax=Nocardia testacea TaxID=248551 RepID=UPI0002DB08CA|nr:glycosyltransferase [Nocardia testacea]
MEFSLVSYLAVRSAAEVNTPDELIVYCDRIPSGAWWDAADDYITAVVRIDPPDSIGGVPVPHPAHRSDLVRLDVLMRDGGIYLDLDVLSVRPLTPFLGESFVLGQEGVGGHIGLCNAVILAEPDAPFGREWLRGWDPATSRWSGFRSTGMDQFWSEMSVQYPAYLAGLFPELITVAPMTISTGPLGPPSIWRGCSRDRATSFPTPSAIICGRRHRGHGISST